MNAAVTEIDRVKAHLIDTYLNGAFNRRDVSAMRRGFHEDFAIFAAAGEALDKFPIADWTARLEQSIANGYDAQDAKNHWTHEFAHIEVEGGAAFVKLRLYNEGVHIYTDFISLLKFDSGWRIAAKIYHQHNERKNW